MLGTYSSGVKTTLKARKPPMETTTYVLSVFFYIIIFHQFKQRGPFPIYILLFDWAIEFDSPCFYLFLPLSVCPSVHWFFSPCVYLYAWMSVCLSVVSIGLFWFYFVSFSYNWVYFLQFIFFEALRATFWL